jgi:hypothetical protein
VHGRVRVHTSAIPASSHAEGPDPHAGTSGVVCTRCFVKTLQPLHLGIQEPSVAGEPYAVQ